MPVSVSEDSQSVRRNPGVVKSPPFRAARDAAGRDGLTSVGSTDCRKGARCRRSGYRPVSGLNVVLGREGELGFGLVST